MINRPILRYHGGKFRIGEWVISHFPPHLGYLEPFAGAASILMQKPRSRAEIINDLDDQIVNLFRVLRDPAQAEELRRRLTLTPYARTEFNDAYAEPTDSIDAAHKMVILSFMGQGSDAVTRRYKTGFRCGFRNRENRAIAAHEWVNWPEEIPAMVERLQGVAIENGKATDVILRLDSPDTLIYCDPPYVLSTRTASRSKHGYRHEMTDEDHRELASVLLDCDGMVIISGYPSRLYDELYGGWARVERPALADRGAERTEVIWMNDACERAQRQRRLLA